MNAPADLSKASLDDKYTLERGRVFMTGTQALIRLMMLQRERDSRAGLIRPASSPAIAARRWAGSTSRCGARRSTSRATTSSFSPG